jgi:hypothetical protein
MDDTWPFHSDEAPGVSTDDWGRPPPEQLWLDLQELHMRIKPDFDPTDPEVRASLVGRRYRVVPVAGRAAVNRDASRAAPRSRSLPPAITEARTSSSITTARRP